MKTQCGIFLSICTLRNRVNGMQVFAHDEGEQHRLVRSLTRLNLLPIDAGKLWIGNGQNDCREISIGQTNCINIYNFNRKD